MVAFHKIAYEATMYCPKLHDEGMGPVQTGLKHSMAAMVTGIVTRRATYSRSLLAHDLIIGNTVFMKSDSHLIIYELGKNYTQIL